MYTFSKNEIEQIIRKAFFRNGYDVKKLDFNGTETIAYVTAEFTANKNCCQIPGYFKLDYVNFNETTIVGFVLTNDHNIDLMK
jgi:hypothetical protein